jgi:AcrR family transcriptional regulator
MLGPETSEKIAAAALNILEKHGAQAVSMRRVAKLVGITPMALYNHFDNREALLTAVARREFEGLARDIEATPKNGSAEVQLLAVMRCYVDYAFARPAIFDYIFSQPRLDARRFPTDFRARRSPTMNRIADIVAEGMRRGELKEDDLWEVALEVWAHVHGYVALLRAGRFMLSERGFHRLCQKSLRRLVHGLKP